jgi:uroporphyrinogen III methyltransferase/synthase
VPGVSSVVAAPNYAGIPITHRDHCSSFTVITGHEDPSKDASAVDWAQIAKTAGTKVILMGVERLGKIAEELTRHGMPGSTPAALVQWGTTGRQRSIQGTLDTIARLADDAKFAAPAVAIVGTVVNLRDSLNWFENRPLFGRRIVVTRTRDQASETTRRLHDLGAETLEIPVIKIVPPTNLQYLADAILELNSYDWLVFTSPNGVVSFFDYFFRGFEDMRDLGGCRIAAIGPATAAKLKELRLKVDLMPAEYIASKITKAFEEFQSVENCKILLLRAEVANPELPAALNELGAIVDDVACYKTVPATDDFNGAAADLLETGADWVTFTSASTVENFHARFNLPELLAKFPALRLASIGPETSKALAAIGLKPAIEAKTHTVDGLVKALLEAARNI